MAWSVAVVCIGGLLLAGGCAKWKQGSVSDHDVLNGPNPLPAQRMSSDSVVLELTTVEVPPDELEVDGVDWNTRLWQQLDETSIPVEVRRRLADNGIRVGIASTRLPPIIEKWLARQEQQQDLAAQSGRTAYQAVTSHQRWQTRLGQSKRFPLSSQQDSVAYALNLDGYFEGRSLEQALLQAEITTYPQPDGKARIDVVPMIEHGVPKQRVDVSQQSYVWTMEREREVFDELRVSANLISGQTLVLTQTHDDSGLGYLFFSDRKSDGSQKKILLIRLAQTQLDDLFTREQIFAPIETPTE